MGGRWCHWRCAPANGQSSGGRGRRYGRSRGCRKLPLELLQPLHRCLGDAVVSSVQNATHIIVLISHVLGHHDVKNALLQACKAFRRSLVDVSPAAKEAGDASLEVSGVVFEGEWCTER